MASWQQDRIGSALSGENPTVLAQMSGGFAVIGDVQWLPGYCVLLSDDPNVERLSDLTRSRQLDFLVSMAHLGEAVELACASHDSAFLRVNMEILGNTDRFLHAHVWPRYSWEPSHIVSGPVWHYPLGKWREPQSQLGPQHDALRESIVHYLERLAAP